MNDTPPAASSEAAATWRELEQLVDELAERARADGSAAEFHRAVVERLTQAMAARGGAVWIREDEGPLELQFQSRHPQAFDEGDAARQDYSQALEGALQDSATAVALPPQSGDAQLPAFRNPTEFLWLLCPVRVDERLEAVIEMFQRPGAAPAVQRGYVQLLEAVGEIVAEYQRNTMLRTLRGEQQAWKDAELFVRAIYRSNDLDAVSYILANDGRAFIGCDRATVVLRRGRRFRVTGVSGVDSIDQRGNLVRAAEDLVSVSAPLGESLWTSENAEHPPQIEEALQCYTDSANCRTLAVVPLSSPPAGRTPDEASKADGEEIIGAVVLEWFAESVDARPLRRRVGLVQRHAQVALSHAIWRTDLPLIHLLNGIRWLTRARQLPYTIIGLLAVAGIAAALILIPGQLRVKSRGELQPRERREVFAPCDGVVQRLDVEHAQTVGAGDRLVSLRSSSIEYEVARVFGELQTARQQLDGIQASRLRAETNRSASREDYEELTAKEEELKKLVESFERQQEILSAQQSELEIISPLNGQIVTWDISQLLDGRPVRRGQRLLTVAATDAVWGLELRVPDEEMRYVIEAREASDEPLHVSFILATNPSVSYEGRLRQIAMAADSVDRGPPTVLVTVDVDREDIPHLRPGATVLANIHCGRRPLGYVWLRDLIHAVQTRILF